MSQFMNRNYHFFLFYFHTFYLILSFVQLNYYLLFNCFSAMMSNNHLQSFDVLCIFSPICHFVKYFCFMGAKNNLEHFSLGVSFSVDFIFLWFVQIILRENIGTPQNETHLFTQFVALLLFNVSIQLYNASISWLQFRFLFLFYFQAIFLLCV